ncbi:MAG: hypothetical protein KGI35_18440, partial [Burkholderiales bacterium]|nr:hypothetical protein [Burkholderiales bacterium]
MTSEAPDSAAPRQRRQFLALLIGAAAGATALIATLLWSARADALRDAQVTALNYARTIAVRMDATLRRADSVLASLVRETPADAMTAQAGQRYAALLDGRLDTMLRGFDEIMALRLVDARGDQRYVTAAASAPAVNYADRAFFRRLARDPAAGLQISSVVIGRVTGRPTIVLARALRDGEGRFIGAALAPVDLSFFQQQFMKLDLGSRGAAFVRRVETGSLVLRWPRLDDGANRPMPASHPILRAVRAGRAESMDQYRAFTDGVLRISGTVAIRGYPLFLTVALSEDDVLASWRRLALLTGLGWCALLLLLFVLQWRLWRIDVERGQLAAQLRESQRIESMGTLAGGIAHDFNNILAAILGNVALARRDPRDEAQVGKSLAQIRTAAQRGRELVQQIL